MQKTVKWIKENINQIVQCEKCGTLNDCNRLFCLDCNADYSNFLDDCWDRQQEVKILSEAYEESAILYI